jgi:hypothetical protein
MMARFLAIPRFYRLTKCALFGSGLFPNLSAPFGFSVFLLVRNTPIRETRRSENDRFSSGFDHNILPWGFRIERK